MKETWQTVFSYDYEVSNWGRVWSNKTGRYLKPFPGGGNGKVSYLYVELYNDEGNRRAAIHALVLEAFVGLCPEGLQCRHLDGDPSNNIWPDNLCWGTPQENHDDQDRHGTVLKGDNCWQAVEVPDDIAAEIIERHYNGDSLQTIANDFEFSKDVVHKIVKRTHWSQRRSK